MEQANKQEIPVPISELTMAAYDLGSVNSLEELKKRILFLHVTRASDGSTDGLNIPRSANLLHLKKELEESFTSLVPNTYSIKYLEETVENDLAWRSCVQAFGETGKECMKLSIHE